MDKLKGINGYYRELTKKEIENNYHRGYIGGLWDELGHLQLEFLLKSGLKPNHKLLDIGCGCLRGGIHFAKFLQEGNYYGLDINKSLIEAGRIEIQKAGLAKKKLNLIVDDEFSFDIFGEKFDFMVSVSVFTHLPMNIVIRCLINARENLAPSGIYYSTFFMAPAPAYLGPIKQQPGNVITNYDSDPFHYSINELDYMAKLAKLEVYVVGDWGHPRNQKMAAFRLPT